MIFLLFSSTGLNLGDEGLPRACEALVGGDFSGHGFQGTGEAWSDSGQRGEVVEAVVGYQDAEEDAAGGR